MRLLKYAVYLTVIFLSFQYLNNFKEVPSFAVSEKLSDKIFKIIPSVSSLPGSPKNSTSDLIETIQENKLQEIRSIWKQLGIKSELFQKGVPFLAESYTLPLDSKGNKLYIFKITNNETNDWQFLCFNIKNRSWNFYGHIDFPSQDSTEPISRAVSIEERVWLVITSKTDSPGLPEMYQDCWYDLKASKLKEVLQYYVYQDLPKKELIKRYSATILETGVIAGSYFIDLNSKITFLNNLTPQPESEAAFSLSRKTRYLWDTTGQLFKNHQPQPDNLYTYGADQILAHNYLQIEILAISGDHSQRNLVKRFLNLCGSSSEKKKILNILNH